MCRSIKMLLTVVGLIFLGEVIHCKNVDYANTPAVKLFQEYLQINTTTYNNLGEAVDFWEKLAKSEGLTVNKYEYTKGMPVVVIKWPGADPTLNSIVLNSHMDVVPADEEDGWTYPPFSGHLSEDGFIYGRGTQDMKSISIQYFEAMKRLKAKGTLLRDVYMTLIPDEEVGGEDGMLSFLHSKEFEAMNVGLALDEGGPTPLPVVGVLIQDKSVWHVQVDCYGVTGHGSTLPAVGTTATGKCKKVMDNLFEYREEQYKIAATAPLNDAGIYTSVNLNVIHGGTANNVIPNHVTLVFDIRLNTRIVEDDFENMLENMIHQAGDGIEVTYILKNAQTPSTIANSSNPYWNALTRAASGMSLPLLAGIPSGATDSRHLRAAGIPAFGVSPMPNTPLLLHDVDERISVDTFLYGIEFYERVISELANIPGASTANPIQYLYDTRVY